jgi:hypothetical protein
LNSVRVVLRRESSQACVVHRSSSACETSAELAVTELEEEGAKRERVWTRGRVHAEMVSSPLR